MISRFIFIANIVICVTLQAQRVSYFYFISFSDKNNSAFEISSPEKFLSKESLQRRIKFKIKVDDRDLPVNEEYIRAICSNKIRLRQKSKWLNGILVEVDDSNALNDISRIPFVSSRKYVGQSDRKAKLNEGNDFRGGDETYGKGIDWDTDSTDYGKIYGRSFQQINILNGINLHQKKMLGQGMLIAVLDAGYDNADHMRWFQKLMASNQIKGVRDFVDNDEKVFDQNGHGLQVLSCMAFGDTGLYIGTAPRANYLLLRSEDAESEQLVEEIYWAVAAEYADSLGVDLINTSLGYNLFDDASMNHNFSDLDSKSSYISIAAEIAFSRGIVIVCSAGNDGATLWHRIGCPADAKHSLAVGAVDADLDIADFSSRGPTADGRIKPDVCALGVSVPVASSYGGITTENGTSFASPILAGLTACLMQAHPDKTPEQIIDAIRHSADRWGIADTIYGMGIPDFKLAGILLGDSVIEPTTDHLISVSYYKNEGFLSFCIYSNADKNFEIKILDANGNILEKDFKRVKANKFEHTFINHLHLPYSGKGYVLMLQTEGGIPLIRVF